MMIHVLPGTTQQSNMPVATGVTVLQKKEGTQEGAEDSTVTQTLKINQNSILENNI